MVVVTGATVSRGRTVVGVVVTGCLRRRNNLAWSGGRGGGVVTDVVVVVVGEGVELAVVRM